MNTLQGPSIGLFAAVILVGIAQGLFLAAAIALSSGSRNRANRFLSALMFAFVLELINRFAIVAGYIAAAPQALSLNWALDFFFGPLVFLYARELTTLSADARSTGTLPHFVLPIVAVLAASVLWPLFPRHEFLATLDGAAAAPLAIVEMVMSLASVLSMVLYVAGSFVILRRHRANVTTNFSNLERKSLEWLRTLLVVLAILLASYLLFAFVDLQPNRLQGVFPLAIVVSVFGIGFLGIRQPAVFDRSGAGRAEFLDVREAAAPRSQEKYSNSALSESDAGAIFADIDRLMDAERLFQANDLSLPRLADRLGLPSHYVSQAINQGSGSNFFDYVNKRRVEFVKQALRGADGGRRLNVLELAMDAGFNSKSAFYAAFKNSTGLTPRQYQRSADAVPR